MEEHYTPLRLPSYEVFNAIKNQLWVKCPRPIQYNLALPVAEEYCSFHDSKGHKTVHCKSLRRYLEELVRQGFPKEYISPPGQPLTQDSRALRLLPNCSI